ncbi:TetR family transcriptional regulator [Acrocarpospora phusangensis]|uniref:TetR family transcriptional regulator n=1 Tax=Acrocarpospora phusangensis TaxID=1070424 RepID=A0A919URA5_9ACTN|nr:TetR/AcrR family transcriptional regulator [Acrocarpospora phusangensis]GIH27827.1 TetR family transcriptional regulator [Acrocarpospora phusangensis]
MSPRKAAALRDGGDQSLRDHLIATCEELMAERGAAGLTVRDIARRARVADGVLYNHFTDKEELLAVALHAHVRNAERALGARPCTPGQDTLEANLRAYFGYALRLHIAIMPAFAGLVSQPKVLARFATLANPMADGRGLQADLTEYLRAEQRLGRLSPAANPEAAATMLIGACHELVLPRMFFQGDQTPADIPSGYIDGIITTLLHGIT